MGHHVVAKFRVLSITQKYDGLFLAELKPVFPRSGKHSPENAEFWSYSPTGEANLHFHKKCPLEIGAYYYVNMVREEYDVPPPDAWTQSYIQKWGSGGSEIYMSWQKNYDYRDGKPYGMLFGSLKMGMEEKAKGAIESFSKPDARWKVTFDYAGPSDDEP